MIRLDGITLGRGANLLLEQASTAIYAEQRVGLVGNNGSGKSSLLALLRGELSPDRGTLTLPPDCRIASVNQETPSLRQAALDYVLDGHRPFRDAQRAIAAAEKNADGMAIAHAHDAFALAGGYELPSQAGEMLCGLGFALKQHKHSVADFSGGWRMRLNLAQALIAPADLLLLDEPTNHLDLDAVLWLQDFLARHRATLILISHDRDFLDALCQHVWHIENKRLRSYRGNYSQFERTRHQRRIQADALYAKQEAKRARIQSYVDRFRAKATKARQAQSRLKALEKLIASAPVPQEKKFSLSFPAADSYPSTLLRLENAAIGYDTQAIFAELSLSLAGDARIGLLGGNGVGKSTLMKALAGVQPLLCGSREVDKHACIGYFTQHQLDHLDPQQTPLWHMRQLLPECGEQGQRNFLGAYGFGGEHVQSRVGDFSGGEKARLALALIIATRPNLLLLDEPTNHLDLTMRDNLTRALIDYRGAAVIISHDRNLLRASCNRFYLVEDGRCQPFDGDLEDYHKHLKARAAKRDAKTVPLAALDATPSRNEKNTKNVLHAQLRSLHRTLEKTEKQMKILEKTRAALENQLGDPALYVAENKERLHKLLTEKSATDQALANAEADWMEAAQTLEETERAC